MIRLHPPFSLKMCPTLPQSLRCSKSLILVCLDVYKRQDYGYALDVEGTEAVLLEPSNGSNYQACAALTSLPDPVWAYICLLYTSRCV